MYMILIWKGQNEEYLDCVRNKDGSIRLWDKLADADEYANSLYPLILDNARVISIDG